MPWIDESGWTDNLWYSAAVRSDEGQPQRHAVGQHAAELLFPFRKRQRRDRQAIQCAIELQERGARKEAHLKPTSLQAGLFHPRVQFVELWPVTRDQALS